MRKIALVGCGYISERHLQNIGQIGELVAVCDSVETRVASTAFKNRARAYTSFDEMLADEAIDLMVVSTPNGIHAEHIIKSLQAGSDVLTEKPLCLTTAAAWQMVETEKYCQRRIFLVQSAPYNPLVQRLQSALETGLLGSPYSFTFNWCWNRPASYFTDWRGKLFPDGGLLYNQFSHYVDVLLLLFGEIGEARGYSANFAHSEIEFEDTGVASFKMKKGALGNVHWSVNASNKNQEIGLTVVAEKGTVRLGGEHLNEVLYVQTENELGLQSFSRNDVDFHASAYAHLKDALDGKSRFPSAFDGLRTVEAIEKIYKAVR